MAECARDRPLRPNFRPRPRSGAGQACRAPARRRRCPSGCWWSIPNARWRFGIESGQAVAAWPVSTARNGIGGDSGSFRTPPGWHRIHARIGAGADARHGVRVARAHRRDLARRGARRRSDPDPHPHARRARGRRQPRPGRATRSSATSTSTAPTTKQRSARPLSHGCVRLSQRRHQRAVRPRARRRSRVRSPRPKPRHPRSARRRPLSLCRARRQRHERARPVPGDARRPRERQRPRLRPRRARRGCARSSSGSASRSLPQDGSGVGAGLRGAGGLDRGRGPGARRRGRARARRSHRAPLRAAGALRGASTASIAVTGTSGKSTVTAMVFAILRGAGRDPSVITGGDLPALAGARACRATPGPARSRPAGGRGRRERRLAWCATSRRSAWCSICSATTRS